MIKISGSQIRVLRKTKGWTIEQLAELAKVSNSTIGMYERGERRPDLETLLLIAHVGNVSLDFFLDRNQIGVELLNLKVEDILYNTSVFERVAGHCELCNNMAPFITQDGNPYLELFSLDEKTKSTAALCPTCVKKMHHLNLPGDRLFLKRKIITE